MSEVVRPSEAKLTNAQRAALRNMQQGAYELVRSGPHLRKLFERGFVDRTGPNARYEPTQAGIRALLEYPAVRCLECGEVCPACQARSPKTRDGHHHPGFNGTRFYKCRTST